MRSRSIILSIALALGALGGAPVSAASGAHHAVAGVALLEDGTWFQITTQPVSPGVVGKAWLARTGDGSSIEEISIDCLEFAYEQPVYPIPPYLPYHVAEASGLGATGVRYHITVFDLVAQPVGFGDRVIIETDPGEGACGAPASIGAPISAGDIVIGP